MKRYLKTDHNGTKYFSERVVCDRCNGLTKFVVGIHNGEPVIARPDDGTCYKCNGVGFLDVIVKEYTPEHAAKLEAARIRRQAKKQAEWDAQEAEREAQAEKARLEAERLEAERLAEIERNRGHFIGSVGDKIQMEVTLDHRFHFESSFGYQTTTMTGYVFKTDDGNTLVWITSGSLGYWTKDENPDWISPDDGDRVTIKGTIKEHREYNDVNQTLLNRVKWVA